MKITKSKSLLDGVCVILVTTSDFSCGDLELMAAFSEPVINIGGLFGTGIAASVTGSSDLSSGYDFSIATPYFVLTYGNGIPHNIVLNANCANIDAVVSHIQSKIDYAVGSNVFVVKKNAGNNIILTTVRSGASVSFTVAPGSVDALTILGITAGAYTGSGDDDFYLQEKHVKVKSNAPFVFKFDSRDYGLARAEYMANTWGDAIVNRIKSAMDTLRANVNSFNEESMITY